MNLTSTTKNKYGITKTYERKGKSGNICYVLNFNKAGRVYSAMSCYNKEDGLGGIDECTRFLDVNGPTVRKLIGG